MNDGAPDVYWKLVPKADEREPRVMDDAFELSMNSSELYNINEAGILSLLAILEPIFSSYLGPFSAFCQGHLDAQVVLRNEKILDVL